MAALIAVEVPDWWDRGDGDEGSEAVREESGRRQRFEALHGYYRDLHREGLVVVVHYGRWGCVWRPGKFLGLDGNGAGTSNFMNWREGLLRREKEIGSTLLSWELQGLFSLQFRLWNNYN